ncbi:MULTISPECIES: HAD family hydrolase [Actinosynnema]|uniref:HAD family hydrolase n=1 Tax=Actinosynnema TaxID=40566 RepID=UPI0020A57662|nr:HAD-IIB family hydrolase [Actinosynnema pretiosum]MCP2093592.1 HAD-superfamily hydrolase, subfamily IIB [Actinosynnema pretiosum]
MEQTPRLIALDIDGTLVPTGSDEVSPAVRDAVGRAVAGGARVVLSTGRSVLGAVGVAERLGVGGTLLCSNGAVWWDVRAGAVVRRSVFDAAASLAVLREALPGAVFASEVVGVGSLALGRWDEGDLSGEVREVGVGEFTAEPTSRLVARWVGRDPEELAARMSGIRLPGATWTSDHVEAWLTVVPEGVSKGAELERLRRELGVDRAGTAAVGDGHNDVAMLRWAGCGVAMGQAPEEVRAAADVVTGTLAEDGAATALGRWF